MNLLEIFHKLECLPWEYIDVKTTDNDISSNITNVTLTSVKKENDISLMNDIGDVKQEENKKKLAVNSLNEMNKNKNDSFQEKIKSIKTISHFSNSLSTSISNSNSNLNPNPNPNLNSNSNLNLTIMPLTYLSQTIPNSSFHNKINNISQQHSSISISSNTNTKENLSSSNNTINNNFNQTNYYIKYYFNADDNAYLFMITDIKNIWYEYIDSEEILNIKKKKNAVNFETKNSIIELIYNNIKSKDSNTIYRLKKSGTNNDDIHYLCIQLSVSYMYVTFNWDFECTLLTNESSLPMIKNENEVNNPVAKLNGSKIFYEHLTQPLILMISELHRRIERYEEVIAKKEKNIKILYDQLLLLEETPPKRFKFEEFNKKIFDEELRFSTDISSSEQKVFIQEDLVNLYKHVTNTVLSKTFPYLVNDEYKTDMNNERLSLIPTLVSESNQLNGKDVKSKNIANAKTISNENSSSSLSYNGLSDTTLQDDDDNNQSLLEELEKEKNKEMIEDIIKRKRSKIETIINKKKDKKKTKKRKLI